MTRTPASREPGFGLPLVDVTADYQARCGARLIEIERDGERIPTLAQVGKPGFMFILNRVTGEPIQGRGAAGARGRRAGRAILADPVPLRTC